MLQLGDICLLQGAEVEPVDLIIGGSPCQNISISGNGTGLEGIESRLFFEQMRVIREMREAGGSPRYMVWENVANIFSCNSGNDFRRVLSDTIGIVDEKAGEAFSMKDVPKNGWKKAGALFGGNWSIAWRLTNARFFGVPQSRRRIAVVADFDGLSAPDVLFGMKPLEGTPTRPVMFERFTDGVWTECRDEIMKHSGYGEGPEVPCEVNLIDFLDTEVDQKYYLRASSCHSLIRLATNRNKAIDPVMLEGLEGNITLDPRENGFPPGDPFIVETLRFNGFGDYKAGDYCGTLRASGGDVGVGGECLVVTDYRTDNSSQLLIRKLAIEECERLQGYDEGWTDIGPFISPNRKERHSSLSARGKALGNSFALPQWTPLLSGIYDRCEQKTMGSLFDGIGGGPLIWCRLGGTPVWASEVDSFPSAVTKKRFGDATKED